MKQCFKFLLFVSLFILATSCFSQRWIDKEAPPNLVILLVERFDTVGKQCDKNRHLVVRNENPFSYQEPQYKGKMYYCSMPEWDLDNNVKFYREEQQKLFEGATFKYLLIDKKELNNKDTVYGDIEKYRYILRPITAFERSGSKSFPKWTYFLYDRKKDQESEKYMEGGCFRFDP